VFYSPNLLLSKTKNRGDLIGFIYGADGTTPLEKGIVEIRNISARTVYKSTASDKLGLFRIEDIRRGLYIVTISTNKGEFISRNLVGIKTNEIAKVSFAVEVKESQGTEMQPPGTATVIASSNPIMYNSVGLLGDSLGDPPADPPEDAPGDPPADPPDDPPEDTPGHEEGDEEGTESTTEVDGEQNAEEEQEKAEEEEEKAEEEAEQKAEEEEEEEEKEPDPSQSKPGT
jgi:outer membrane biosynthesis protein TonB